ncbi:MAG: MoaD/ThiS family protein [Candidatus Bipolaricaulia bacterium]
MRVHVRLMVTREQILQGRALDLDLTAPATIADGLRTLARHDRSVVGPILTPGPDLGVRPGLALLLNGVNVLHSPQGLETPVSEGDNLSFIHGISGG